MKKKGWKYLLIIFGYTESVGMTVALFYIFISAYLNGYKATVLINEFGEAHVELIALSIIMIVSFLGCLFMLKDWRVE